jgi:hypothetical protein
MRLGTPQNWAGIDLLTLGTLHSVPGLGRNWEMAVRKRLVVTDSRNILKQQIQKSRAGTREITVIGNACSFQEMNGMSTNITVQHTHRFTQTKPP